MSIKNIVATARLPAKLDLDKVECGLSGDSFQGLCWTNRAFGSLNIKSDKSTLFQLFKNGRVIVVGGTTEGQTKRIFLRYLGLLSDLGISIDYQDYHIQNIVACYDYGQKLDLYLVAQSNKFEFEPELFPAVRYRDKTLKVTVNIFHTGKCTILGAKSVEVVSEAVCKVREILQNAKCAG